MRRPAGFGGVVAGVVCAVSACASSPAVREAPAPFTVPPPAAAAAPREDEAPAPDPEISAEAYRSVLEAEMRLQTGDVPAGIQLLREAVIHDPRSPYLHTRLAEAYLESGDVEQARASAQDALAINRKYVPAWRIVGASWSVAGDHDAARKAYREALSVAPGDRDTSMQLAELLVDDGDLDGAEHVIETLMDKEPGAVDGYISLARAFAERGQVERAFKHVARALDRDAGDADALSLKLTLLWGLGRFDEALPVARSLAAAAGDGGDVRRDLLSAHVLAGATAEADALATAWLDDNGSEDMRLLIADAYERSGEIARAAEALEGHAGRKSARAAAEIGRLRLAAHEADKAVAAACPAVDEPAGADASAVVAAVCARALARAHKPRDAGKVLEKRIAALGPSPPLLEAETVVAKAGGVDKDHALADAAAALAADPSDADIVSVVARMNEELGDVEHARAVLDDALRARPKDPDLLFALARHLDRQKQPMPAVEIVERLMDRGLKGLDQLNFVAFTLAEAGARAEDARRYAWRAVVQDPLNGYVVDTLGWCQLVAGDVDKAVETLRRADRLSPGEGEILFHLAAALDKQGDAHAALDVAARARGVLDDDDPVRPRVEALWKKLNKGGGA